MRKKTNKEKKIKLNDTIKTALKVYIKQNKIGHDNISLEVEKV